MQAKAVTDETYAFFDVDDTLITGFAMVSMFAWLQQQDSDRDLSNRVARFQSRIDEFPNRSALLTAFFSLLKDQSYSRMLMLGERWFHEVGRGLLKPEVIARAAQHHQWGDRVVLVSGSWLPCLRPLGREVGAEAILGCELEVDDRGLLTGIATNIMVGDAKAVAIRSFARERRAELGRCFAYGDDPSDIPMLQTVGHPIVVGEHPRSTGFASASGWDTLPVPYSML
jgi:HAD superfamily hydrolase (TIGR01490 family)